MRRIHVLAGLLLLAACGDGNTNGFPMTIEETTYLMHAIIAVRPPLESGSRALLLFSTEPKMCDHLTAMQVAPNRKDFMAFLYENDDDGHPVEPTPGTYTVVSTVPFAPGRWVAGNFIVSDAQCVDHMSALHHQIQGGTLTLDAFDMQAAGTVSGRLDLVLGDQADHVNGPFDATPCAATLSSGENDYTCR